MCAAAFAHNDTVKSSCRSEQAEKKNRCSSSGKCFQRWEEEVYLLSLLAPPTLKAHNEKVSVNVTLKNAYKTRCDHLLS